MIDRISRVGIVVSLVVTSLFSFSTSSEKQMQGLRNSLDSLELLIQEGRRNGDEIDLMLEDAESLKVAIETHSDGGFSEEAAIATDTNTVTDAKKERKKLRLPSSLIDWMIVLVGAVALLAALLLAALHLVTRFHRNKLTRRASVQIVPKRTSVEKSEPAVQRPAIVVDSIDEKITSETDMALPTYTRQGMMKTAVSQPVSELSKPVAPPVISEDISKIDADHAFVSSMIADLMKKKESVDQGVSNVSAIQSLMREEQLENRVSEFQDEVKTFDDLYDGLEDIMAELDDELIPALEKHENSAVEEMQNEPVTIVPKPTIKSTREQIMELHEAGMTATEIGRKLSKSVGEVQLILSMARRS